VKRAITAAAAAVALAGCGGTTARTVPGPTVTVTATATVTARPSASPSGSVNFTADEHELVTDGTGSTLCTDAADGALTASQQQSYVYETANVPGQFSSGDLLTPHQARQVLVAVMEQMCPQQAGKFTFNP
jgi:curli biogenesis system outer membrane secretion channel CsgG